jgi:signal transduction histidine kinase
VDPRHGSNDGKESLTGPVPPTGQADVHEPPSDAAGELPGFFAFPEHPPRERLEWLLAAGRLLFVAGALLATLIWTDRPPQFALIVSSLGIYLVYSLAIMALVWRPLKFARGWSLALHLSDLVAFSWLTLITEGSASPFFMSYVFLAICGTLRWQMWGALATGALSIAALGGMSWFLKTVVGLPPVSLGTLLVLGVHLAIVAALLGYLGTYHHRFQREIAGLTTWPRRIPEDRPALVAEVVSECARIFRTARLLLVWEEPGDGHVHLVWMSDNARIESAQEPEGTYESLVAPRLEQVSFQAMQAGDESSSVIYRVPAGFRQYRGRPLNEALRVRFGITAVQSWPVEGELVHGRLFSLDKARMEIDQLSIGALVARLVASRLDALYMLQDLRQAVALSERVRLASDLHDSLLQALAGAGLQLMVARRLIDRDPARAAVKLEEIQTQIEQGELEMRSFIRRLRPQTAIVSDISAAGLADRLQNLGRRIERQWNVKLKIQVDGETDYWVDGFSDEVFRIVREGILNAARHADASIVNATVSSIDGILQLEIADDGRGFPFHGTYDLSSLESMNQGPWSLKERVSALQGTLTLTSTDSGSRLFITLGIPQKAG